MNNLFSVFDPQSWLSLNLNWLSSILVILMIPPLFWVSPSQVGVSLNLVINSVFKEFKAILTPNALPGMLTIPLALFTFIALTNGMGLTPYTFTSSSHLVFTVGLALPLWLGHMLFAWVKSPNPMLAHLVPLGTPGVLMPFMVLIEMVSSIIRPLTLSVRLAANIIAGHLLITLLSSSGVASYFSVISLVVSSLIALSVLECAVSMIQAYVFSVLSTLYLNEVDSPAVSNL